MNILTVWIILAGIVAIVAGARGRSAVGWLFLSVIISPLLGLLFVMAMPNLKHEDLLKKIAGRQPAPLPKAKFGGKADRVTVDRTPRPFEPDGVLAGVPYRVANDGSIHAVMQGATVRFQDFDKFTGALGTTHGQL